MFTEIKECIDFIQSQQRKSTKSLEHMKQLCEAYGNPEKGIKYIHVAGTNGKGSVVAYLKTILMKGGLNVGTFTSPFIECFNERIAFNNSFIEDDLILKYANEIIDKYDYLNEKNIELPSFFSFITLMCFMYFRDIKPDVAIIEVGIGGLLDSTNVIKPILSIISNVSYDHMNVLGDTLNEIAYNKLGIVKESVPLITLSNEEINNQIIKTCEEKNSSLILVDKNDIKDINVCVASTTFTYKNYKNIRLKMLGKYQTENASIVIEACELIKKYFDISYNNIIDGLNDTFWPGRLEVVQKEPYIILDGAHNIDGIQRLHEFIKSFVDKKVVLVMAISSNKETFKMINEIEQDVDKIIFTSFNYKRSEDFNVLYEYSKHKNKEKTENIERLVQRSKLNTDLSVIWIFSGSLYFVSELRKIFK